MPDLVLHRRVQRYTRRLPGDLKEKVKASLIKLAEDPDNYPGSITMAGQWQGYKASRNDNFVEKFIHHLLPEVGPSCPATNGKGGTLPSIEKSRPLIRFIFL